MGNERQYIRNLALTLMRELKVDQKIFSRWENFPPVITPSRVVNANCGDQVYGKLTRMTPSTLGRITSFGRQDYSPHYLNQGTTLFDVLGEYGLHPHRCGVGLILTIARATIIAEMTDILLERLTPEQRAKFNSKVPFNDDDEPSLSGERMPPSEGCL